MTAPLNGPALGRQIWIDRRGPAHWVVVVVEPDGQMTSTLFPDTAAVIAFVVGALGAETPLAPLRASSRFRRALAAERRYRLERRARRREGRAP